MGNPSKNKSTHNAITITTFFFFTFFPLIVDNYYYNITITKYYIFCILALGMLAFTTYYLIQNYKASKKLCFPTKFSIVDWIFLFFITSNIFSCLCSVWIKDSFTGDAGKHIGLCFVLLCGCIYYSIVNYFILTEWFEKLFPVMLLIICGMAIIQSLGFDFLGFYADMSEIHKPMYLATFGHINLFSVFLSVYLPIVLYYYCFRNTNEWKMVYLSAIFLGYIATFCSNSDSSYIGLVVSLLILLILSCGHHIEFNRFFLSFSLLPLSMILWRILTAIFQKQMHQISSLSRTLTSNMSIVFLVIISLILFGICYHDKKQPTWSAKIKYPVITCVIVLIAGIIGIMIWFTCIDTTTDLGSFENLLRFNKSWGSNRGYVWSWLIDFFLSATIFTKLFGTGPDTTALVLSTHYQDIMSSSGDGSYYTTAHNEYLNYLITIGIVGTFFYILLVIISIIQCAKKRKYSTFHGAIGLAIICYAITAFITISQPITMPFIFLLIALANKK